MQKRWTPQRCLRDGRQGWILSVAQAVVLKLFGPPEDPVARIGVAFLRPSLAWELSEPLGQSSLRNPPDLWPEVLGVLNLWVFYCGFKGTVTCFCFHL